MDFLGLYYLFISYTTCTQQDPLLFFRMLNKNQPKELIVLSWLVLQHITKNNNNQKQKHIIFLTKLSLIKIFGN